MYYMYHTVDNSVSLIIVSQLSLIWHDASSDSGSVARSASGCSHTRLTAVAVQCLLLLPILCRAAFYCRIIAHCDVWLWVCICMTMTVVLVVGMWQYCGRTALQFLSLGGSVWGLGSRHVGPPTAIFWGTDLSVPQRRYAGEPTGLLPNARQPTCRLPNDNLLGSRQVCSRTPE